jgi:ATP-binding cassette subfamily B protein
MRWSSSDAARARQVGWQLIKREPVAYGIAMTYWVAFHALPTAFAFALKAVLDRIQPDAGNTVWLALAVLGGMELGRWAMLLFAVVQWHGQWVFWHALPQHNVLRSLVSDPGPVAHRLPGSSGEAVSRFRDDSMHISLMMDVWLDIVGATVAAAFAVAAMFTVDVRLTLVVSAPMILALWVCRWLGHRLRVWRRREREATAAVTGFIGDAFGAIGTLKLAGAQGATTRRFAQLGDARAEAARVDQVATQVLQTLSAAVGDLGTGFVVLLLLPALTRGSATVGDVGLFTASIATLAGLPRWVARTGATTRQATVSVDRLTELFPEPTPERITERADLALRPGPGALAPAERDGTTASADRLKQLEVSGLTVHHAGVEDLDLVIERGTLTVITGPVGSGKSTVLRALLGLVGRDRGEISWNGEPIDDPALVMVPPRAAYVAQTPRLFSEPLSDAILLGAAPDHLDDAVRLVCLDDEVAWMPEGMATVVGARGVRLSGGQVQRTATARALVRRPELLVIDDLSSALDVETEAHLWRGLVDHAEEGFGAAALLVVSHRPAVLDRADQIIDLTPGKGTPSRAG